MVTVQRKAERGRAPDARLVLAHVERQRARWRATLDTGEVVGVLLPRGTTLDDGDLLEADDGRVIAVLAAEEDLLEIEEPDAERLARAAWHLGNRHASVEVLPGRLRTPADRVIASMLGAAGYAVHSIRAAFRPEPGAYAAGAHAHSSDARHAGIIHDFAPRPGEQA